MKININKPTGSEALTLLSAIEVDNVKYIIFDSEKIGSMGLPIIYISKLTDKLEKISDNNEWQSVKNYLKGIISGTNFLYIKVDSNLNADEAFYTPLTLPQSSFDLIKSKYVIKEEVKNEEPIPENKVVEPVVNNSNMNVISDNNIGVIQNEQPPVQNNSYTAMPNISPVGPIGPVTTVVEPNPVNLVNPVMPEAPVSPSISVTPVTPMAPEGVETISPNMNVSNEPMPIPQVSPIPVSKEMPRDIAADMFMQDKETFLKACENMFDALVSKYQKQLTDLQNKEQNTNLRSAEVPNVNNAVGSTVYDNVMNMDSFMPESPNN